MFKKPIAPLLIALSLIAGAAHANEAAVRKSVEAWLGGKVSAVRKTDHLGLYEILVGNEIYYTDEKVSLLFAGNIIDTKTRANLTQDRLNKLSAIKFSDLPLELAIKQVRGDGKRVLATFEDPNCGYCKRLAKDIQKLDNVTVYTFLYPILSEDSLKKSRQIWCSADRAKAWNDWIIDGKTPGGRDNCDTSAITRNLEFGRRLNITGTPTIVFADGERVPGAVPLNVLEQKLAQPK